MRIRHWRTSPVNLMCLRIVRCNYRLDKLKNENGEPLIAKDAPVSYKITSRDARVVVQGSRILTSGENSIFASFGTVMAWCPQ